MNVQKMNYLPIITRNMSAKIDVELIKYIVRENRKLLILTGEKNQDYSVYRKIEDVVPYLNDDFAFATDGMLINFKWVRSMRDGRIDFWDGGRIDLGRDSFIRTRQRFNQYLREKGSISEDPGDMPPWRKKPEGGKRS